MPLGKPLARASLGFGDFARGHFVGNVGAAMGGFLMSASSGKVEPLVRFNQIAGRAVASCGERNAQIKAGPRLTLCSPRQPPGKGKVAVGFT